MLEFFSEIDAFVWGPPLLVLLVCIIQSVFNFAARRADRSRR